MVPRQPTTLLLFALGRSDVQRASGSPPNGFHSPIAHGLYRQCLSTNTSTTAARDFTHGEAIAQITRPAASRATRVYLSNASPAAYAPLYMVGDGNRGG